MFALFFRCNGSPDWLCTAHRAHHHSKPAVEGFKHAPRTFSLLRVHRLRTVLRQVRHSRLDLNNRHLNNRFLPIVSVYALCSNKLKTLLFSCRGDPKTGQSKSRLFCVRFSNGKFQIFDSSLHWIIYLVKLFVFVHWSILSRIKAFY